MKKKVKFAVIALLALLLICAFFVHLDDIRAFKKECDDNLEYIHQVQQDRTQSALQELLATEGKQD